jgi:hypothetical protein
VKIILPDNPLRETVTADGPVSLKGMFEVGYSLIVTSGIVGASTDDPPGRFFKSPQTRTAILLDPRSKTASKRRSPKDPGSTLAAMRWPPISVSKIGWPKGVPRIAKLDEETRRQGSRVASRPLSPKPNLITISLILPEHSVGRSVIPSAYNDERLRQPRSNTKVPISEGLAKTCRALAIKAHPTQRAGSGTGSAQAQRDYFQDCIANRSQKLAKLT